MDAETPIEPDGALPDRDQRPRHGETPGSGTGQKRPSDLRSAMRTARIEDAERSRAITDIRSAEIARLELLREAIEPVLAEVPGDVDMFDAGLIPVPQPRLFIDMIAFVEMAHDKRSYRFVQDTRQGRIMLAESDRLEVMREAVTAYIARRLVEREKALAAGDVRSDSPRPERPRAEPPRAEPSRAEMPRAEALHVAAPQVAAPPLDSARLADRARPYALRATRRRGWLAWLGSLPSLALNYLGLVALCVLVWVIVQIAYRSLMTLVP